MKTRVATVALTTALTAALAAGSLGGSISPAVARTAVTPKTHLTFEVKGCEGCDFRLTQALDGRQRVWQSRSRKVKDGKVSWRIPTSRTHGLSVTVLAPWDGGAGYVPTVAFRYAGKRVGDEVTNAVARTKRKASTCWAGTVEDALTLAVTVVHARSTNPPGDPIRTPRAFTSVTQDWQKPMERAFKGITGTQDVSYCG
jgi:hypothetical protein